MPTNEERREVARKLREKQSERNRPDVFMPQSMGVMAEILYEDLISCVPNRGNIFLALADLIEPEPERTCRKVPGRMRYGERKPKCSECGYSLGDPRWFYCPKCGGKITNDRSDT